MKNPLVTLFGDKLRLFSTHSERMQRRHSNRIDRQLRKEHKKWKAKWNRTECKSNCKRRTYLLLEVPCFERPGLLNQLHVNFPQTFGLIAKHGILWKVSITSYNNKNNVIFCGSAMHYGWRVDNNFYFYNFCFFQSFRYSCNNNYSTALLFPIFPPIIYSILWQKWSNNFSTHSFPQLHKN